MRFIVALLLAFPVFADAQDCNLKKNVPDVLTQPNVSTGFFQLQGAKATISGTKNEIEFFFVVDKGQPACFNDDSQAALVFEGTRLQTRVRNSGTTNCEGFFNVAFKTASMIPANLNRLTQKKVTSIVFTDRNEKEIIVMLSDKQQELLMKLAKCIIDESKALK